MRGQRPLTQRYWQEPAGGEQSQATRGVPGGWGRWRGPELCLAAVNGRCQSGTRVNGPSRAFGSHPIYHAVTATKTGKFNTF